MDVKGRYIDRVQLTAFWNASKTSGRTPHGRAMVDWLCDHCRMSRMYWATDRYMVARGWPGLRYTNHKICVLLAVAEIESDLRG